MSKRLKIELNSSGIAELLESKEVGTFIENKARECASRCGNGYRFDSKHLKGRVVASYYAGSYRSYRDNLLNNTLLKNKY